MKMKRAVYLIAFTIFFGLVMLFTNQSKAAVVNPPLYLGIQEYRTNTDPQNMAYGINNPDRNGSTTADIKGAKIWDIVKYNSLSDTNYDNSIDYYCVKAGIGFRNTGDKATYNVSYDFKAEKGTIAKTQNSVLKSLVSDEAYYKILAITDLMYIPGESTIEDRTALKNAALTAAGIDIDEFAIDITDTDIEAVQQAALWYFTNYDDEVWGAVYNQLGLENEGWFTYKTSGMSEYQSFKDYRLGEDLAGEQRTRQAVAIYNYLINTAKANEQSYKDGTAESRTKITLYANATDENTQPVIVIEKLPPEEKEFDMALRKYITKINGVELAEGSKRNPEIDESTLKTGTTATYNHRKDPVSVSTGTIVTYNITVYNEGEKSGRVTKIVDQLPTGLKFSKLNTSGFTPQYNETTNQVTITRNQNNVTNLQAYKEGALQSETIEIECEVTQKPDQNNNIVLTNVAWIAEEYDAEDNVTITNQEGADRDSEPSTIPDVNKDNMSDYKGTTNQTDLSQNIYYPGEQDDDDFEKLVLLPKAFDLKLTKRIVEVNGEEVPNRIESVDITNLANGSATTGTYNYNKEPVSVKQGDIVKYTLRIYNEGDIDGYASEISEDVPEGLEFLWSDKMDDELDADTTLTDEEKEAIKYNQGIWNIKEIDKETNRINMISTDYLAKGKGAELITDEANLIKAFDKTKGYKDTETEKNPDYKEVSVYMKVVSTQTAGTIIRNEAAITEDTDANGEPVDDRDSNPDEWVKYEDDEDYDNVVLEVFDLALRKFIAAVSPDVTIDDSDYLVNEDGTYERAPEVDTSELNTIGTDGQMITTATYNHPKTPVEVNKNDYVVYMLRVYNEGQIDGYASEITDYLPEYLEFVDGEFNNRYGWTVSEDGRTVTTNYLKDTLINKASEDNNGTIVLTYKEVPILCRVKDTAKVNENITNIAEITEYKDENKEDIIDRDSQADNVNVPSDEELPGYKDDEVGPYVPGQQDDDDFEKVIIKPFDLALRKFITAVDDEEVTTRIPEVSYNEEEGKIEYNHTKVPVKVVTGDIVTYTIRIFNEGEKAGYAKEVADDIPDGLEFLPNNETNQEYRWVMYDAEGNVTQNVEEAEKIVTDYLSKEQGEARMEEDSTLEENPNLLQAFNPEEEISETNPDYRDVKVAFRVVEPNSSDKVLVNSAQIQEDEDENGNPVDDIDSTPGEWNEGEDDQDKEYVELKDFDLALRKFITAVDDEEVTTRIPQVSYNEEEGKIEYNHTKEPVEVVTGNIVTYTIRIFNEGESAGYAKEVADDIPDGLEFLPDNEINQEYRWVMYDAEGNVTQNVEEAEKIVTDYLSKEQGEARMEEDSTLEENPNLLQAFNPEEEISETNPDYRDVKVAFRVVEPNTSDKILVNSAQIQEDENENGEPVDDIDSTPGEWNEGEDDQDKEYVKLTYFDLSLRKWVTQAIVIENGKETITQTGHTAEMDPEPVVKVELHRKKLDQVTVKFRYSIRVTNEGDIAGYAKEITDYVPEGLRFIAEDNPGWTDEGNNVISTRLLENTLLQPGESAEVEVLLTWINGSNNLGLKTNTAEISEDYNDKGAPDIDSTPDNKVPGEDDIDDAEVILSISTGQARIYYTLGFIVLITIGGGVFLIKRFVL